MNSREKSIKPEADSLKWLIKLINCYLDLSRKREKIQITNIRIEIVAIDTEPKDSLKDNKVALDNFMAINLINKIDKYLGRHKY